VNDPGIPADPAWWQRGIIYQIYPWSFADASGDGIGDLAGVRSRVDYLRWLGVDAVWMSPIYPSPGVDLGYDISDYRSVDPHFGTLEDLDDLLSTLHARNIRLILDLVPNHTSDRHPWFLESRRGVDDPRHAWYVWRDGDPAGPPPNNWLSYFGGPAWRYLDPPGGWYLHSFDPAQPDLDWHNPAVRAEFADIMRFWLGRGVDGFRVDVLWLLGKDPELRDDPLDADWREGMDPFLRLRRESSEGTPEGHVYVQELRTVLDEFHDRVMIGEVVLPPERAVAYHGAQLDEVHMPHNFALARLDDGTDPLEAWSADGIRTIVEGYEAVLPPGAWPNWLLGDHDFPRIATRLGPERARLAAMLLLTLRGTPTWYYGDELGLPDAHIPAELATAVDPQGVGRPGLDRLPVRSPMPWTTGPNAGFSDVEPWLPLASDDPAMTVERQREDPDSMLTLVRSLIELRRRTPALAVGTYRSMPSSRDVLAYERSHPAGDVEVHLNFEDGRHPFRPGEDLGVLLSTDRSRGGSSDPGPTLAPFEGVILGRV